MGEEVGACCEMKLWIGKLAGVAGDIGMGSHTNRAFWRHWTTSEGSESVTWRCVVPAEAS